MDPFSVPGYSSEAFTANTERFIMRRTLRVVSYSSVFGTLSFAPVAVIASSFFPKTIEVAFLTPTSE